MIRHTILQLNLVLYDIKNKSDLKGLSVEEANSLINLRNSSHPTKPHISTIFIDNINIIIIFVYHLILSQ